MGESEEILEEYYFKNLKIDFNLKLLGLNNKKDKLQLLQPKIPNNTQSAPHPKSSKFFNLTYTITLLIPEMIINILYRDSPQLKLIFQKYNLRNKLKLNYFIFILYTKKSNISK